MLKQFMEVKKKVMKSEKEPVKDDYVDSGFRQKLNKFEQSLNELNTILKEKRI